MFTTLRRSLAGFAARRAARFATTGGAARWHRLACALTPSLIPSFRLLTDLLRQQDDRWGARTLAQQAAERFPEESEAWMLLGEAWLVVYRHQEALTAFEQALTLAERPDAALAAGEILRRSGRYAEAAERFSRAKQEKQWMEVMDSAGQTTRKPAASTRRQTRGESVRAE